MSQRILNKEVDKRATIKVDKNIKADGVNGIMQMGANNDYSQLMEKLINGSVTGKAAARTYAKFLTGGGFEDESINDVIVGKDARGKNITCLSLLRQTATSLSKNNGAYIHRTTNLNAETGKVHLKLFKNGRFAAPDDTGYSAQIGFHENWEKDPDKGRFKKNDIVFYKLFSNDTAVVEAQMEGTDIKSFKGQIYFISLDDEYFYPLSPFDPAYLDLDTEAKLALFMNKTISNGMLKKILLRVAPGGTEEQKQDFVADIIHLLGPDGEPVVVLEDEVDADGNIKDTGAFKVDSIDSNIDSKVFDTWEKKLANNIRKAVNNLPALLIEFENSSLGTTSGEAIKTTVSFYNALIEDDRKEISKSFSEIFKNTTDPILSKVTNWDIKPFELIKEEPIIPAT